ncbi:hypothetical protein [Marinilabilia sp.]|uniref:hypothetical protein n=1 Tax=Marinilabilia sp. TaxID=2021252 RepID=UPI0025BEFB84|nr:hypothetical protein [Marinilabilia sp.]
MMSPGNIERGRQAGFVGGTLTGIFTNISLADVMGTIVLSAIGASVSFLVSLLLKRLLNGRKRK